MKPIDASATVLALILLVFVLIGAATTGKRGGRSTDVTTADAVTARSVSTAVPAGTSTPSVLALNDWISRLPDRTCLLECDDSRICIFDSESDPGINLCVCEGKTALTLGTAGC